MVTEGRQESDPEKLPGRGAVVETLDHGHVRLVNHMGRDLDIVRSARVSYDADWRAGENQSSDSRLIRYLIRNQHSSPFESVVFTFEIQCPIFIARQWHRHRTWSYNEVSARYAELALGFYVPSPHRIGVQSEDNKQVREFPENTDDESVRKNEALVDLMQKSMQDSLATYNKLLSSGVPTELARSVLPVASYTRFFGTVDLHNLFHFIRLRRHEHAQWEIREYAEAMLTLITPIVPVAAAAFKEELARD